MIENIYRNTKRAASCDLASRWISSIGSSLKSMGLLRLTVFTTQTTTGTHGRRQGVQLEKYNLGPECYNESRSFPPLSTFTVAANSQTFTSKWISKTWRSILYIFYLSPPHLRGLVSTGILTCTVVMIGSSSPADLPVDIRRSWQSFHLTAECTPLPALLPQRRIKCWNTQTHTEALCPVLECAAPFLRKIYLIILQILKWHKTLCLPV